MKSVFVLIMMVLGYGFFWVYQFTLGLAESALYDSSIYFSLATSINNSFMTRVLLMMFLSYIYYKVGALLGERLAERGS